MLAHRILCIQFVLSFSRPRQDVIRAAARHPIVANPYNSVFSIHNAEKGETIKAKR